MSLPALAGGGPLPADPIAAMRYYASLGLRVLPIVFRDKLPHPRVGNWGFFQDKPPLDPRWIDDIATWGPINVALICDPHLVVIDIDNLDFVAWFDAQGPERKGTWIVRTPSGGLHVYCRSRDEQHGTIIKSAGGIKIADVKARGGYVVAPPSEGANGDYEVECGSPDAIRDEQNALEWFREFVTQWDGTQPVRLQPPPVNDGAYNAEYNKHQVQNPPPQSEQDALTKEVRSAGVARRMAPAVARTLLEGVVSVNGYWKDPSDRSAVDFGCVKELIGLGWALPKVEQLFAFCVQGERYREPKSGHGYLLRTFDNARAAHARDQADLNNLASGNWRLLPPFYNREIDRKMCYEYGVKWTTPQGQVRLDRATVPLRSFNSKQRYLDTMADQGIVLDLGNFDSNASLVRLSQMIADRATEYPMPQAATRRGQALMMLRTYTKERCRAVRDANNPLPPRAQGWTEGDDVYVFPDALVLYAHAYQIRFEQDEVWDMWEALGGREVILQGRSVWRLPKSAI